MGLKKLKKQNSCVIEMVKLLDLLKYYTGSEGDLTNWQMLCQEWQFVLLFSSLIKRVHATAIQSYVLLVAGLPLTLHTNISLNRLMMYREQF
jgi:hypothetical protein